MTTINCRSVRREIEEAAPGDLLSSVASDHMKTCIACGRFCEEHLKLQEIVSSLGTIEAPGDFDFRLRARLAGLKHGAPRPWVMLDLSYGFRAAAFATVLLLIGSAFLFVRFWLPAGDSLSANNAKPASSTTDRPVKEQPRSEEQQKPANEMAVGPATNQPEATATLNTAGEGAPAFSNLPGQKRQRGSNSRGELRTAEVASVRGNGSMKTRDLGSMPATVFRPIDPAADTLGSFPIGASYQSLKVSLDDGRGTSRTISLPSISFGSQRVLARGASPLLVSARGSW